MRVAVVQFPGSNCDKDAYNALRDVLGVSVELIWHKEDSLGEADAVILPGGFSFGDYLRCGAIAQFSPIMAAVKAFAGRGGRVLGICNGFQVLCESGLLPGCLVRNNCMEFRCQTHSLKVEDSGNYFNKGILGEGVRLPIAHGDGNYQIDKEGLQELEENKQVLFRYTGSEGNPNGSLSDIAGIRNREENVFGMMPHPERAVRAFHPSRDGVGVLRAFLELEGVK